MQKYADYIKQIEIESLWSGTKHILWNLAIKKEKKNFILKK